MLPSTISLEDYLLVYNFLSLAIASMGASTVYFFMHAAWVAPRFKTAMCITGLVTLIAFYHYFRIFESWTAAWSVTQLENKTSVEATGAVFNDAYRYVDWLLTVPLLLLELILVMRMPPDETASLGWKLGSAAALMIILGYPGEISSNNSTRWVFWALAMIPFTYIVFTLFVRLKSSLDAQPPSVRGLISSARYVTVLSWCVYPIVFVLPMLGLPKDKSVIGIQVGYSIADIIAKCGVGIMISKISMTASKERKLGDDEPLIN